MREYQHWVVLLRPAQITIGSLVLACKLDATALSEVPADAFAELSTVISDIEAALRVTFSYDKINYLLLMMVHKYVHFHVLPRYASAREVDGFTFEDPAWPGLPDIVKAFEGTEGVYQVILAQLRESGRLGREGPARGGPLLRRDQDSARWPRSGEAGERRRDERHVLGVRAEGLGQHGQLLGARDPFAGRGVGLHLLGTGRPGDDRRHGLTRCQRSDGDVEEAHGAFRGVGGERLDLVVHPRIEVPPGEAGAVRGRCSAADLLVKSPLARG